MTNPLAANCQAYAESRGKVTGVKLSYLAAPTSTYELVKATLIDEETAQGQTIANIHVLDKAGLPARVNCYLAWPWEGWQFPNRFENHLLPGNTKYPFEHVITNKYYPPGLGPLAIYIGDAAANVMSDVLGGLGLPAGHHVSFDLVFRERGGNGVEPSSDVLKRLQRIEEKIDRLCQHFGIPS